MPVVQSLSSTVSQCSVSCGNGKKQREVECSGGRGLCDSRSKPQAATNCNLGSCPEWKIGDWSQVHYFGTGNAGLDDTVGNQAENFPIVFVDLKRFSSYTLKQIA